MLGQLIHTCLRLIGRSSDHSIHSISGYAWGIAVIIAISGIMTGFSTTIFDLTDRTASSSQFSMKSLNPEETISNDIVEKLSLGNFTSVVPIARYLANFTTNERSVQVEMVGTNLSSLLSLYVEPFIIEGTLPRINQTPVECLQGFEIRGYLTGATNYSLINENASGNCELVGTIAGVAELQQVIMLHLSDYQQIVGKSLSNIRFNEVKIRVKKAMLLSEFKEIILELIDDDYQNVIIWKENQGDVFAKIIFKEIKDKLELLYLVIFLLVMIRLYHNITWFTITYERTFLIMRALGLSRKRLFLTIIILGTIMGNIGFIMGILIGLILPPAVLSFLTASLNLTFIVVSNPLSVILQMWLLSMAIIIVSTIIPSWKISRTPPSRISILIKGI